MAWAIDWGTANLGFPIVMEAKIVDSAANLFDFDVDQAEERPVPFLMRSHLAAAIGLSGHD